jgi:hypothetical protein
MARSREQKSNETPQQIANIPTNALSNKDFCEKIVSLVKKKNYDSIATLEKTRKISDIDIRTIHAELVSKCSDVELSEWLIELISINNLELAVTIFQAAHRLHDAPHLVVFLSREMLEIWHVQDSIVFNEKTQAFDAVNLSLNRVLLHALAVPPKNWSRDFCVILKVVTQSLLRPIAADGSTLLEPLKKSYSRTFLYNLNFISSIKEATNINIQPYFDSMWNLSDRQKKLINNNLFLIDNLPQDGTTFYQILTEHGSAAVSAWQRELEKAICAWMRELLKDKSFLEKLSDKTFCQMIAFLIRKDEYELVANLEKQKKISDIPIDIIKENILSTGGYRSIYGQWLIQLVSKDAIELVKKVFGIGREMHETIVYEEKCLKKILYLLMEYEHPDVDLILMLYKNNHNFFHQTKEFSLRTIDQSHFLVVRNLWRFTPVIEQYSDEDIYKMMEILSRERQYNLIIAFLKNQKEPVKIALENIKKNWQINDLPRFGYYPPHDDSPDPEHRRYYREALESRSKNEMSILNKQKNIANIAAQIIKEKIKSKCSDSELYELFTLLISENESELAKEIICGRPSLKTYCDQNSALHLLMQYKEPNVELACILYEANLKLAESKETAFPLLLIAAQKDRFKLIFKICNRDEIVKQHTAAQLIEVKRILIENRDRDPSPINGALFLLEKNLSKISVNPSALVNNFNPLRPNLSVTPEQKSEDTATVELITTPTFKSPRSGGTSTL